MFAWLDAFLKDLKPLNELYKKYGISDISLYFASQSYIVYFRIQTKLYINDDVNKCTSHEYKRR